MTSEWLKVMLVEIACKKAEAEQARIETTLRREENERGGAAAGERGTRGDGSGAPGRGRPG